MQSKTGITYKSQKEKRKTEDTRQANTKRAYPVLIKEDGKQSLVYIPDWDLYTEGENFADAIAMARDAIGLVWVDCIGTEPEPSTYQGAIKTAEKNADDSDFRYSDGILTYVDVDVVKYSEKLRNRAVRKNVTLPYWLNEKAEEMGINFSRVLQDALLQAVEG